MRSIFHFFYFASTWSYLTYLTHLLVLLLWEEKKNTFLCTSIYIYYLVTCMAVWYCNYLSYRPYQIFGSAVYDVQELSPFFLFFVS
jgi:hypothetical protein